MQNIKLKPNQQKKDFVFFNAVLGVFIILGIGSFIASSFYKVDYQIADSLYRSMEYKVFRGWEAFTIMDGNSGVITGLILMALILFESLVLYVHQQNPLSKFGNLRNYRIYFYVVGFIILALIEQLAMYDICFGDKGFGKGFDWILLVGYEYTIPIYVVSALFQFSYFWSISYLLLTKIGKNEALLTDGYWQRAGNLMVMIALNYILVLILKPGMSRIYYYNVNWETIFDNDWNLSAHPERQQHYLDQDKFNWGFRLASENPDTVNKAIWNIPESITNPWYRSFGFFSKNGRNLDLGIMPKGDAFPSGHVPATIFVGSMIYVFAVPSLKVQRQRKYIYWSFFVALIYLLDMIFALAASSGHWWSDMACQLFVMPIWFVFGYLITYKGLYKFFAYFGKKHIQKKN